MSRARPVEGTTLKRNTNRLTDSSRSRRRHLLFNERRNTSSSVRPFDPSFAVSFLSLLFFFLSLVGQSFIYGPAVSTSAYFSQRYDKNPWCLAASAKLFILTTVRFCGRRSAFLLLPAFGPPRSTQYDFRRQRPISVPRLVLTSRFSITTC